MSSQKRSWSDINVGSSYGHGSTEDVWQDQSQGRDQNDNYWQYEGHHVTEFENFDPEMEQVSAIDVTAQLPDPGEPTVCYGSVCTHQELMFMHSSLKKTS